MYFQTDLFSILNEIRSDYNLIYVRKSLDPTKLFRSSENVKNIDGKLKIKVHKNRGVSLTHNPLFKSIIRLFRYISVIKYYLKNLNRLSYTTGKFSIYKKKPLSTAIYVYAYTI